MIERSQNIRMQGLVIDVPPEQAPPDVWTSAANFIFDDGGAERAGGMDQWEPGNGIPLHIRPLQLPNTYYWLYASTTGFFVTDGVLTFDITPPAHTFITEPSDWTSCELNGVPVFNNGFDAPFWWDGDTGNVAQRLPDWPVNTRCKAIRAFKYHLFAMNITVSGVDDPDLLYFSDAADPGTIPQEWTPSETNQAGSTTLSASPGGIVDAEKLRDQFLIYKDDTTYICSYVAGGFVFNFRKLLLNSGIQSRNCVVEQGGFHIVMTQDDILKHDGQQSVSMLDGRLRKFLFDAIDTDNFANACMAARHSKNEIWIGFPLVGSTYCNLFLVFNYIEGKFGLYRPPEPITHFMGGIIPDDIDRTYDGQTISYDASNSFYNQANYSPTADQLLMADAKGSLNAYDRVSTQLGAPTSSYLQRTGLQIGDPQRQKLVKKVWPRIVGKAGQTIQIRVGMQKHYDDPIAWCPYRDYVINDTDWIDALCQGKYMALEVSATGGDKYRVDDFIVDYSEQGRF